MSQIGGGRTPFSLPPSMRMRSKNAHVVIIALWHACCIQHDSTNLAHIHLICIPIWPKYIARISDPNDVIHTRYDVINFPKNGRFGQKQNFVQTLVIFILNAFRALKNACRGKLCFWIQSSYQFLPKTTPEINIDDWIKNVDFSISPFRRLRETSTALVDDKQHLMRHNIC